MKKKYYCNMWYSSKNAQNVLKILAEQKIKFDDIMGNAFVFQIYSDNEKIQDILDSLDETPMIESIFSEEEMEKSNWYTFEATRFDIETSDNYYTYEYTCPYPSEIGTRYRHQKQINPFISKRTPKWKNNYNFCSINTGDCSTIFCSDLARHFLENHGIMGVDFMPVVNRKGVPTENVHQLIYPNVLPTDALKFIGEYKTIICPTCGTIKYFFKQPMEDNMRIVTELIPPGIDMFVAERAISQGWGGFTVVVSKKVYNLISKVMKEKHVRFYPL